MINVNTFDSENAIPSDIEEILVECCRSTAFHCQFFHPELFYSPENDLLRQMLELIDSGAPRIAIAAPRGIGKTTTLKYGVVGRKILFRMARYVVYITNNGDNAITHTEGIKSELLTNTSVRQFFGPINAKDIDNLGLDDRFSKKSWVTNGGTLVLPRGWRQQVRGLVFGKDRPDLIILDDYEDKDEIQNPDIRAKMKERFSSDVMKCISRYDKNFQFIYVDTLKHEDSILQDLLDDPDWESVRLEACDDNYNSNAPEYMSTEEIKIEVAAHRRRGELDVFYREYRNLPISKEDAVFKAENFRYFREGINALEIAKDETVRKIEKSRNIVPFSNAVDSMAKRIQHDELLNVVIVDPAKTVKLQSADSAIVGIGVHRASQRIMVRSIMNGKYYPNELYDNMFLMCQQLNAMVLGIEVTSLNEFITQPIRNEMVSRNVHIMFEELKAKGKKEDRIASLAPYYNQGYIYHNIECCGGLEAQLLGFPRSKLFDIMDALAYIVLLMDKLNWMFDPPDSDPNLTDDYAELHNEKPLIYQQVI